MRIGIDARIDAHGIGTYTRALITHLQAIDEKNEYVVFCSSKRQADSYGIVNRNFKPRLIPAPIFSVAEQIYLPYYIKKEKLDLFHSTSYVVPILCSCTLAVTIHDVLCKTNSVFYPPFNGVNFYLARAYYNFMNWYAVRAAKHIGTVSNFAKTEIRYFYPATPEEKITVIYNGVGPQFHRPGPPEIRTIKEKYHINGSYILFVGTLNPRKNLLTLIKAFAELGELRSQHYKLVVAAKKDMRYPAPFQLVEEYSLGSSVLFIDYVSQADLPALYAGAAVFVLPSLHESFGLPIVEAFACGTPVITSNRTALPEIAGNAALLIDPFNVQELKEAILKIISDRTFRNMLVESGLARARSFSWETAAEQTRELLYEKVLLRAGKYQ